MAVRKRTRRRARRGSSINIKIKPTVAREIWAIVYLSVGILTVLSIKGAFGIIGDGWVNMLKPILGWGIFVIPGVFILVSLMLFLSRKISFGASRILGLFLFVASILSILHLSVPAEHIYDYAVLGGYGGYIGFVTNFLLIDLLGIGRIGATIIFVTMFLVSLVLVFEVPLMDIFAFVIPKIKIEMSDDRKHGKLKRKNEFDEDEEYEEEKGPEIFIHKSKIGERDIVYDENENKNDDDDIVVNKGKEKNEVVVLENQAKPDSEEDYEWEFPSMDLLVNGDSNVTVDEDLLRENAEKIKKKLMQFDIDVAMQEVNVGPTVIQYTLKPSEGVKLSKITALKNDIALTLAAERIRIEAPIPGKSLVGIEAPNSYRAIVYLREILESPEFLDSKSKLTLPLGRDVSGKPVVANLEIMPHLLIAGATGSGKSVAMNGFLTSLLYQNAPHELKFIMVDTKRVELSYYNNIPHLLTPVIHDPEKAAVSLKWVAAEMNRRYSDLSEKRVRNIFEYNELDGVKKLPRIIVVIDELADLMMVAGKEVEASICRIAQMARAVGIHLIVATQRPSVDVVTGLIKANIPTRIAFAMRSQIDSRTILDGMGAEDLVGKGDMLFLPTGKKPLRIQGIYVSTEEIERVTNRVKLTVQPDYDESVTSLAAAKQKINGVSVSDGMNEDDMYEEAFKVVIETRKASASLLQRRLKVGYARAARLIDLLEENGVVGPSDGAKARKILT
ncbi:DNA translocase FtsK 4TM domain-containing protein [Candidatus Peregrinibacteria bacterium]|nr:DNA translocase FtsK 4TM domain-containing protein [Candidatus Peregrinibacteria bacterium]